MSLWLLGGIWNSKNNLGVDRAVSQDFLIPQASGAYQGVAYALNQGQVYAAVSSMAETHLRARW